MKVTKAEIVISAVKPEQYPNDPWPHFALAGRSNVGKSSFINKMLNRKNLARTSSKPGKTQTLNFYNINDIFYFVDVPGYGFAKVSKKDREAWGKMIETYLTTSENLRAVIQIVDIRHKPTEDDKLMYNFCKHYEMPVIIIATKADKIPKGKWDKHLKVIKETLNIDPNDPVVTFSSETGKGKDEAWSIIQRYM
ncbi:ribosome biogenesis GTP-binding protein YsxC/EngB [Schinkia azotoformans MEV2011]|uniref:Probable GTP-binding protein EngB n=2 Tax=Schinkia azotoformans TaxID=1454 RepID=K6DQH7_SCHAZ|nr:ribosome biogenesis GTP-binding protein YihA/YsxC [Schinkia azotoformans]EKN70579.1 GTP-binding protein YsxC [Schinkia azotoformans LMG 9581]KEF39502.1 ribosome biogenesis GTP-binding protein YsxC/EngB [Schinkia azotoformans MEV2011]MEC1637809.1 ribosome biogenesis GTP-binding protein YihA/YsxC [Schinkia azotoformans]MEC1694193.1 ribosome biogenesis GTP-binding protein YihA/YsxC [Schinkia azotoformans]MEC1715020.1 ribosome biogenesis GTP-binding protein YihA/YsxC [Schinkia azotoformans]